ncbi:MAG TPA: hypothetical protein VN176_00445 [Verrucomicrobiae bacterium]|jgi:hypothetical protein|nr:hypothetical protein [Verrucomicrobiae bacterium]
MDDISRPRSVPDPTLLLFLMAGTLVCALLVADPTARIALVCLGLLPMGIWLFRLLATVPAAGTALLVVAAAVPRGAVDIGGLNVRPEHVAVALLCLALPLLMKRRLSENVAWVFADYLLAVYVGLNILSSLVMSPDPPQTLKWSMQQTLAILPYFFLRVLVNDEQKLRWAFRAFLVVGTLAAAYGLTAYYSNLFFGTSFGVDVEQYGTLPATYGSQYEANVLGAYCGAYSVAMLAMYLQEKRRIYLVGYGITLAGMTISLSRGALGATVIGLLVLAYCARRMGLLHWRAIRSITLATACMALVILPVLAQQYAERLSTIDVADPSADENTALRLVQIMTAVDDILQSPVMGNGTASFQLFTRGTTTASGEAPAWIANSELRILHDTGVVGFLAFVLFLGSLVRQSRKRLKRVSDPILRALLVSMVVYCISFQATEGTMLAFTWVHLGLIGCALGLAKAANGKLSATEHFS